MSLHIEELKTRVAQAYPDVEQVDAHVVRFYKRTNANIPFSAYYLEISPGLPDTEAELRQYIERVIGSRYFDEPRSLQWNTYLYFIRNAQALREPAAHEAKKFIESNREYARKFVIDESKLDRVLWPSLVQPTEYQGHIDVASRWADVLAQPHLIEAVFGQHALADRKRLIDGTKSPPEQSDGIKGNEPQADGLLPRLRRIEISQYRPCLQDRAFRFADVNLLVGVNGCGKTSLLEAIELYYCGRTRRNLRTEENYRFTIETEEGTSKTVSNDRPEQVFRDCARSWFGIKQPRNQPSRLCDAFGRFCFLNTDAAIDLSRDGASNIGDDLARLLVGSDASVVWQEIERLAGDVTTDLRRDSKRGSEVAEMLKSVTELLAESSAVKKRSNSLRTALRDTLRRNEWASDYRQAEAAVESLVEELSELRSVAQLSTSLDWLDSPITLSACQEFVSTVDRLIVAQRPEVQRLESLIARHAQLAAERIRNEQTITLIAELRRLVEAGVERRANELAEHRKVVTGTVQLLAGIDKQLLEVTKTIDGNASIAELVDSVVQEIARLSSSLKDAQDAAHQFASARERSIALAQQLRSVATKIIGDQAANECPLCHTRFAPGELSRHMAMGIDDHVEAAAQKLLANVAQLKENVLQAEARERVIRQLGAFCVRAQVPNSSSLVNVLSTIAETQRRSRKAQSCVDALTSEEASLRANGLSNDRMNAVRLELQSLGHTDSAQSLEDLAALRSTVEDRILNISAEEKSVAETMDQIRTAVRAAMHPFKASSDDLRAALSELEEQRTRTEAIYSRLMRFLPRFKWSGARPVAEWIVEVETVENLAAQLQTTLGSERVAESRYSETLQRKQDLEAEAKQLTDRVARLSEAAELFQQLKENHSLSTVTQAAMENNRKAIERIFSQIHSPAEFEKIEFNEDVWSISRKNSSENVRLTQVSTGQRAAFALSVFLAQNARLQTGPPVILIDDPIAHVDDLNCLSFLDYLRDVAMEGTRQIFFATASDKLGNLFQRKFDFLGDQFVRLDLAR